MRILAPALALIFLGCGAQPVEDPSLDEPFLATPVQSQLPAAVPGCESGGVQYSVGATFTAQDGCNTCSCTARGAMCTKKMCNPGDLRVVHFLPGSAVPKADAMLVLGNVIQRASRNGKQHVFVLGYATPAEQRADPDLPERRAQAVTARLRSLGLAKGRVIPKAGTGRAKAEVHFRFGR